MPYKDHNHLLAHKRQQNARNRIIWRSQGLCRDCGQLAHGKSRCPRCSLLQQMRRPPIVDQLAEQIQNWRSFMRPDRRWNGCNCQALQWALLEHRT